MFDPENPWLVIEHAPGLCEGADPVVFCDFSSGVIDGAGRFRLNDPQHLLLEFSLEAFDAFVFLGLIPPESLEILVGVLAQNHALPQPGPLFLERCVFLQRRYSGQKKSKQRREFRIR